MASRHGHSGHGGRDTRGGPSRESVPASSNKRAALNEYWIEGDGINREVLQAEICRFLGAEATSRPGDYNGRPGFKIRALRPFTPEMLEDLRAASRDYAREKRAMQDRGGYPTDFQYEDSQAQAKVRSSDNSYSSGSGYPAGASHGGQYASEPTYGSSGYPGGSGYAAGGHAYPSGGAPPSGYGGTPQMGGSGAQFQGRGDPGAYGGGNYTYGSSREGYPPQGDPRYGYGSQPGYPPEPPRSRGEAISQYPAYAGNDGRPPMPQGAPMGYSGDTPMGGYSAPYGGQPPRQAPSPYDGSRDPYGGSRAHPDPYSGGGSRRR